MVPVPPPVPVPVPVPVPLPVVSAPLFVLVTDGASFLQAAKNSRPAIAINLLIFKALNDRL
ncbi:hypothetical protein DIU36_22180 [Mucilaginibacter rubeus]|nr:hypothetical protein DIU36_22180 [Mucilaginibacter rubeus]